MLINDALQIVTAIPRLIVLNLFPSFIQIGRLNHPDFIWGAGRCVVFPRHKASGLSLQMSKTTDTFARTSTPSAEAEKYLAREKDVRPPERYYTLQRTLRSLSDSTREGWGASLLASGATCFKLSPEDQRIGSGA